MEALFCQVKYSMFTLSLLIFKKKYLILNYYEAHCKAGVILKLLAVYCWTACVSLLLINTQRHWSDTAPDAEGLQKTVESCALLLKLNIFQLVEKYTTWGSDLLLIYRIVMHA